MGFKKDEEVVCINNHFYKNTLTLNKIYKSLNEEYGIFVINDVGENLGYPLHIFKSLSEYRESQINKILK
jgi:hypothetical protein